MSDQMTDLLKEYKINNMLRKLRVQGLITIMVGGNQSTWVLVKPYNHKRVASVFGVYNE